MTVPHGISCLFVYGTLRQGFENPAAQLLHGSSDYIGRARAQGHLYNIARYPGFVPSNEEDAWVYGDVYLVHAPELTYLELDKYEGCAPADASPHEYRRAIIPVRLDTGDWIEASIYIYAHDTIGKPRIASGDYLAGE